MPRKKEKKESFEDQVLKKLEAIETHTKALESRLEGLDESRQRQRGREAVFAFFGVIIGIVYGIFGNLFSNWVYDAYVGSKEPLAVFSYVSLAAGICVMLYLFGRSFEQARG